MLLISYGQHQVLEHTKHVYNRWKKENKSIPQETCKCVLDYHNNSRIESTWEMLERKRWIMSNPGKLFWNKQRLKKIHELEQKQQVTRKKKIPKRILEG